MDQNDGIWAAVVTAAVGLGGILGKAFGTPKERAEPVERAAELALRMAEKANGERDDCHERLDVITGELDAIRVELRECDVRAAKQQAEIVWMTRAIKAIQKTHSEPPPSEY
jgi:soluble cytochrome b562